MISINGSGDKGDFMMEVNVKGGPDLLHLSSGDVSALMSAVTLAEQDGFNNALNSSVGGDLELTLSKVSGSSINKAELSSNLRTGRVSELNTVEEPKSKPKKPKKSSKAKKVDKLVEPEGVPNEEKTT